MRKVFAIAFVLALASVASATTWWGNQARYTGIANVSAIFGPEASIAAPDYYRMEEQSMRFTAPQNMTITSVMTAFNSISVDPNTTIDGLAPTARLAIYTDDGTGAPNLATGLVGTVNDFTVPNSNVTLNVNGGSTVSLTGGTVYHIYMKATNLNINSTAVLRVPFKWAASTNAGTYLSAWDAANGNVRTYDGTTDPAMALLYKENYDLSDRDHLLYPKPDPPQGWTQGQPDDLGKSADPRFSLYNGASLVWGQGVSAGTDYSLDSTTKRAVGEFFWFQNTGAEEETVIAIPQVKLGLMKAGAPTTNLFLKVYSSADVEIYSLQLPTAGITTTMQWLAFDTPGLSLVAEAGYTIAVVTDGNNNTTNKWTVDNYINAAANVTTGVGFQGDYAFQRTKSTTAWATGAVGGDMYFALVIPEPATLALLAIGAVGVLARRRRK